LRSFLREYCLPLLLLAASAVTTTANGARFMQNFLEGMPPVVRDSDLWPWPWLSEHPHLFASGFAFSCTLLGILLVHELGHYFACRAHGIDSTLPWVLPAPTLSGTLGAVIRIRSRIPSRNALMDVGIYGPLAGYAASALAIAIGFLLSGTGPAKIHTTVVYSDIARFGGEPFSIRLIHALLMRSNPALPSFEQIAPHPVLIAGWIGLFITALNLIPGGQLDGGHILFAISPRLHRISTRLLPFVLILCGLRYWAGWALWGLILLIPVMRHPRVSAETTLSRTRIALGVLGLALFVLTFTPTPFYDSSLLQLLHK
jgi:membrane-associated protease RseP (regulator of RpoE activity)